MYVHNVRTYTILKNGRMLTDGTGGCGSGCGRVRTYVVICHGKWYLNITEYRDLFILYQTI